MIEISRLLVIWCLALAILECTGNDESANSTKIVRKRRYLDFIPKSRMFVRQLPIWIVRKLSNCFIYPS